MKSKTFFAITLLVILLAALSVLFVTAARTNAQSDSATPPLPTQGPPPTAVPAFAEAESQAVTSQTEAIRRALEFDAGYAVRKEPLSEASIAENPASVTVEYYATRQEAADVYDTGIFVDPVEANQSVWVVIIRGEATIHEPLYYQSGKETDGVTYIIGQQTGHILLHADGILPKVNVDR